MSDDIKSETLPPEAEAAENQDSSTEATEETVTLETPEVEAVVEEDPVALLEEQVADLKDKLLRSMAETENVRRRAERDKMDASAYAVTSFARDMLDMADNLKRALESAPEDVSDNMKPLMEGVDMTQRNLISTFEKHGIKEVNPDVGTKFDHNLHQAMFEVPVPADQPNSVVMQVVSNGFVIKDRLLRPAMVGVSKAAAAEQKVDQQA